MKFKCCCCKGEWNFSDQQPLGFKGKPNGKKEYICGNCVRFIMEGWAKKETEKKIKFKFPITIWIKSTFY